MPKRPTLRDILTEWLGSSDQLKVFTIDQNTTGIPSKDRWHIWYHCWAALEIQEDRLVSHHWNKTFLAGDPKFFVLTEQFLLAHKRSNDEWLEKEERLGRIYTRWTPSRR